MDIQLTRAVFLRRYKRFFADVRLADGSVVQAHVPNTGSMRSLQTPEVEAWLTPASDPGRKLRWTLTLLGTPGGGLALVDTGLPNRLVAEGVVAGTVPELAGYALCRREAAYGSRGSRCDLLLTAPGRADCFVEIKNVTMASETHPGRADFPDAVTERGAKHLAELTDLARDGKRAVQFFLVDRSDCDHAGIAAAIDPDYAAALTLAVAAGVEVVCYRAALAPDRVTVGRACPFTAPGPPSRPVRPRA